ncbi:hypothetical protein AOLI_G00195990, partial [Acnodon oligacanthus]
MAPSQMCKLPTTLGTNSPPHHQRCWLLNFVLITIRTVLFLFGPEDTTSMISKNNVKCGLVRPQDTFPERTTVVDIQISRGNQVNKHTNIQNITVYYMRVCVCVCV